MPAAAGGDYLRAALLGPGWQLVNIIATVRDITRFREAEELKSTFISVDQSRIENAGRPD